MTVVPDRTIRRREIRDLWVKSPGESDGPCQGGPTSGQWFDAWAVDFVTRSQAAGRL